MTKKLPTAKKVPLTGKRLIKKLRENLNKYCDELVLQKEENRKLKIELNDLRDSVRNWRHEQIRYFDNLKQKYNK